jgi:hypothetical protein
VLLPSGRPGGLRPIILCSAQQGPVCRCPVCACVAAPTYRILLHCRLRLHALGSWPALLAWAALLYRILLWLW